MQIEFNWTVIILGAIIMLGFFASVILWLRKNNQLPNRFLSLFLLSSSLWLIHSFFQSGGIFQQDPDFYFKPIYYSFAFGPLIYFYVKSLTNSEFKFKLKHVLHFIPVVIQAALYWILTFQSYSTKRWYWINVHEPITYRIEFDATFLSLAIYLIFSIKLIIAYQKWLNQQFSEYAQVRLDWLKVLLALFILLCFQWFAEVILRDVYNNYHQFNFSIILLGLLTLVLAFGGILQENLSHIRFEASPKKSEKISSIDPKVIDIMTKRMIASKDFLEPTLTLKSFADQCNLPVRTVSEHINQGLNQSFHDFVNHYRVEEVKAMLMSKKNEKWTLESIAYECGFNSKATFNRIFKKFTNTTPSQYKG